MAQKDAFSYLLSVGATTAGLGRLPSGAELRLRGTPFGTELLRATATAALALLLLLLTALQFVSLCFCLALLLWLRLSEGIRAPDSAPSVAVTPPLCLYLPSSSSIIC